MIVMSVLLPLEMTFLEELKRKNTNNDKKYIYNKHVKEKYFRFLVQELSEKYTTKVLKRKIKNRKKKLFKIEFLTIP